MWTETFIFSSSQAHSVVPCPNPPPVAERQNRRQKSATHKPQVLENGKDFPAWAIP